MPFISSLEQAFEENYNAENAMAMAKYLKNNFVLYGLKTEERRLILKKIWNKNQDEVTNNVREIALELFEKKHRDFHYSAIEIVTKELRKKFQLEDIDLIEKMIITHSWWDSVDSIAKNILGVYLTTFPDEIDNTINRFSNSNTMWLNRSALLFQLGYKEKTDFNLLKRLCEKHKHSNEFFIRKAIGWALRDYARTNPDAVFDYVDSTNLKPLSTKEALKHRVIL
ncbi:DNA alkylation repair protein [Flavobacterium sp. K5-23]|uniref:DNA alkylation repair protein n=1 Tax=Flavobacterium sp. K5-23 TaxID=2746225 RepID=UPI002010A470|nr:DNA alkylation repair protein [Flavobacterium sp. K5-23]UQD57149.1 DNA alkylation repair protein [Flavobacterium sp. K5-23]